MPAGVVHRLLEYLDGGFLMVGSYPKGKSWDMCYRGEDDPRGSRTWDGSPKTQSIDRSRTLTLDS